MTTLTTPLPQRRTAPKVSAKTRERRQRLGYGILGIVGVLVPWELLVRADLLNGFLVSSPSKVIQSLVTHVQQGLIWHDLWVTFQEWVVGFLLAAVVGIAIGLVAGWFRHVRAVAEPWLNVLYAAPELALVPMFILWFGIGLTFKVWLAFTAAIFTIAVNTIAGVHGTDKRFLEVANTYGANRRKLFRTVVLPGSIPYIMTGLRQGSGRAVVGVIAGEFIAANQGIGFFITLSGQTLNTTDVMVGVLILAAYGIAMGELFRMIEAHFEVWRRAV